MRYNTFWAENKSTGIYFCRKLLRSQKKCEKFRDWIINFLCYAPLFLFILMVWYFRCNFLYCTNDTMWWGCEAQAVTTPCRPWVRDLHFTENFMSESWILYQARKTWGYEQSSGFWPGGGVVTGCICWEPNIASLVTHSPIQSEIPILFTE